MRKRGRSFCFVVQGFDSLDKQASGFAHACSLFPLVDDGQATDADFTKRAHQKKGCFCKKQCPAGWNCIGAFYATPHLAIFSLCMKAALPPATIERS